MYDVIIVGGGPAGITAGIYCARANLKTLIVEQAAIGGQIASAPKVENYPGITSISGADLACEFANQVEKFKIDVEYEEVLSLDVDKKLVVTDYGQYQSRAIIIATGAKYRLLGLENEIDYIGKGISFCTTCDGAFYKDKNVAVIGSGNSAVSNAIYLANICHKVYLILRSNKLKCEKSLINILSAMENIEIIYNSNVTKIIGDDILKEIVLNDDKSLKIQGMFLSIGMDAQTSLVKNILKLNEDNYIISNDCKTNCNGIFVAGDCRDKTLRQLTTAVGDGAIAAKLAINYLENEKI